MGVSNYYKYSFTSPEPLFALVKEEFKSYFDSGAVDDTLFPIYVSKCLKKLGRGSFPIGQILLDVENSSAKLPPGFKWVREAWLCTHTAQSYRVPGATYTQTTSTRIDTPNVYCEVCKECEFPDIIKAVYKTTREIAFTVKREYLLEPGNVSSLGSCSDDCLNIGVRSASVFDVRDGKIYVNFPSGIIHLVYYFDDFDKCENQLIPDDYRIMEFIEAFLKYKIYEQLSNQVTDETANQIERKKMEYEKKSDEAYIMADIETKKETIHQKHRAIKRIKNSLNKFKIR